MNRSHTHPCADCRTPVDCPGSWEGNHDGFPEVICDVFHRRHWTPLCEDCDADRQQAIRDEARVENDR